MRTFWVLLLLIAGAAVVMAQDDCPIPVNEALSAAEANCADMSANEICYGYGSVETVVNCEDPVDFDSPGDVISSESVCALRTSGMQTPDNWGVAVATLRVDDTNADIRIVTFGDVEITNAGSAFNALEVWTNSDISVRSGPGSHYDSVGELPENTEVVANGCNCTGNWLRVVLEDDAVGWVPAGRVTVIGDADALPTVSEDTPVYESLQAFTLRTGQQAPPCDAAPPDGVLIQVPSNFDGVPLQINNVTLDVASTVFLQSAPGGELTIDVLDGTGRMTTSDYDMLIPAGARAVVAMSEDSTPQGVPQIAPYDPEDMAALPVSLLPEVVTPANAFNSDVPVLVGAEACEVVSGAGEADCALHFINPDGDAITRMSVEFVSAPQGDWSSTTYDLPELASGDAVSGVLAWRPTCSLGSENFIGPVTWTITVTDEAGHRSEAFQASFSCVEG